MSRNFYKLLIIGNLQSTILHIPTGNGGITHQSWEFYHVDKELSRPFFLFPGNGGKTSSPPGLRRRRLFAHVSQGHHPIIPFFQHSIIPINCERSELSSNFKTLGLFLQNGSF
jgi:hypothetical protein